MRQSIIASGLAAAIMAYSAFMALPANAATINWTLVDIKFDDGAVATGTFSTDLTTGYTLETGFNISISAGLLPAAVYDPTTSDNYFPSNPIVLVLVFNDLSRYLQLTFENPLASPGYNPLVQGDSSRECDNCVVIRSIVSGGAIGHVAETPLPAALPLFATGLGALGLIAYRRKRKAKA